MQILAVEINKALNHLSSPLMSDLFKLKETKYNKSIQFSTKAKTTSYGINSITYMGPKIWNLVPDEIKESKYLIIFKHKLRHGYLRNVHAPSVRYMYQIWISRK